MKIANTNSRSGWLLYGLLNLIGSSELTVAGLLSNWSLNLIPGYGSSSGILLYDIIVPTGLSLASIIAGWVLLV